MTCTSDYSFKTTFRLVAQRDDFIRAFVTYFDAEFRKSHYPFVLSTSPHLTPTHWRQTVFYIDRVLRIEKGEIIDGSISIQKYKHNFRDLAVELEIDVWASYCKENFTNSFVLR